jgi:hypothetical protein
MSPRVNSTAAWAAPQARATGRPCANGSRRPKWPLSTILAVVYFGAHCGLKPEIAPWVGTFALAIAEQVDV